MNHDDVRAATRRLHAAAVKFEHNAHLGQPRRSWEVYQHVMDQLATVADVGAARTSTPDRTGLAAYVDRVLFCSKHAQLDHAQVEATCEHLIDQVNTWTAEAKAARP